MSRILYAKDAGFESAFQALITASRDEKTDVDGAVRDILADVKKRGDTAVLDYTARWDRLSLTATTMRFPLWLMHRALLSPSPRPLG